LAFQGTRGVRQVFSQNEAQSICNLSTYCLAVDLIDSHDAILRLHVETQSFCFFPNTKPQPIGWFIGCLKFAVEGNIVPSVPVQPNSSAMKIIEHP
jgi:hypothetical protein